MSRRRSAVSLGCGVLLLLCALCTFAALFFLLAQDAVQLPGVLVLTGFGMIQLGFGGALYESGIGRRYFPYPGFPMHLVLAGCAVMLIGIAST